MSLNVLSLFSGIGGLELGLERAGMTCPQGHPYDEVNTHVNTRGSRVCRVCRREISARSRRRRQEST